MSLGLRVRVGPLLGYIEYPSHYENGLDSPVGLVFRAEPLDDAQPHGQWFTVASGEHARGAEGVSPRSGPSLASRRPVAQAQDGGRRTR